ncbi:MAG: hypothetical protein L0H53_16065 [Candidatus Nitrosocosmicus sp.]|nr:hypothetical protein [Candidatus Nitrosocosmicus sp.]MDN5869038.1 hypothetical protein [Candidatus Nitrosocosmicus sp.]
MEKVTLEELKEMAEKHLSIQLEMLRKLPSLNIKDALYFSQWYTFNPLQNDITDMAIRLKNLKKEDLPSS